MFLDLGLDTVRVLPIAHRKEAGHEENLRAVAEASAVFFTGGDQLRIVSILGGTSLWEALQAAYKRGVPFMGTSAGASVMSDTMIVEGLDDEPPVTCTVKMAPGLGLLEEVVIDQHFAQRGRIGRLLMAIAQNPYVIGLGLDEDTAALIDERGCVEIMGSQTAIIVDGSGAEHTNVSDSRAQEPLAFSGVMLHVLPAGYGYDLFDRRCFTPEENSGLGGRGAGEYRKGRNGKEATR